MALVACIVLVGATAAVAQRALRRRADARVKCASNLRQIGLAAITYSDDKRYFPTFLSFKGPPLQPTIPRGSDVAPRCIRALVFTRYLDPAEPAVFTCPESGDTPAAHLDASRERFGWGGVVESGENPIAVAGAGDRDAEALGDLSYGWTVRGLGVGTRGDVGVAADRAGDVHRGWNVLHVDGHVVFVARGTPAASRLTSTEGVYPSNTDHALCIWDETNERLRR